MITRSKSLNVTDLGRKCFYLLLLAPLAILLSTAATGTSNYIFLLVFAAIIFFTVLTKFQYSLIFIGLTSYFLSYAIYYFNLPGPLINLGYVLILMVLIREYFFTANMLPVRTPVNAVLIFIIALGFLSIAAGNSGVYPSFKGLLRHIGFPLLFVLIVMAEPDEKLTKKIIYAVIAVAFVQVVASTCQFIWYSTVAPKPSGMRSDLSGGLLGFSCGGYTATLMAMVFCLIMGFAIVQGFRWYLGLAAISLLAPIYFASARAGVYLFGAAIPFMLIFAPLSRHGSLIKRIMLAFFLFAAIIFIAATGLLGPSFQAIFNPDYAYEYSIKQADSGMGRLQAFEVVSSQLRTPLEKLVGRGPGMLTPTSITENPNSLIAENPKLFGSVSGYAYTTLELGFIGMVLFLLLYLQVYRFVRRFLILIDDKFWESVALGFCGSTFIYVISTFYIDSWIYYPLPFTFWVLAAAIYRMGVIRGIFTV